MLINYKYYQKVFFSFSCKAFSSVDAVEVVKERGGTLDDVPGTVAQIIEIVNYGRFKRMFTQGELPGVTLHTLKALSDKGILEKINPYDGVTYWKLTGKEL